MDKIPPGASNDEAALGYNAFLIAKTGKDEWGNFLPLQFRSFGDWKLPVYIYFLSFVFKFFPLSIFWTRIISAFFGSLTIILIYYFVLFFLKEERWKKEVALLAALILTFNPWHFGLSRTASEANLGLFFFIAALSFFKFFLEKQAKKAYFFLCLIFSIFCFYSYHTYRILLPATFIYLYFVHQKKKKDLRLVMKIFLSLVVFLVFLLISTKGKFLTRLYQINLFSEQGIINQINEFRGGCSTQTPLFLCKLFFNKPVFWTKNFLFNYFSHLSPQFLFFPAFEKGYSILPHYSFFHLVNLLFFSLGFIISFKDRKRSWLFFLLLISPLASSLTGAGHFARPFPLVLPIVIFSAIGVVYLINFLKKRKISFFLPLLLFIYSFFVFELFLSYFTYFPFKQARYSHYEYRPLFQYLEEVEKDFDHLYISRVNHDTKQYVFYLFYFKIKPDDYFSLEKEIVIEENGWAWVRRMGKFEFIDQPDSLENYPEKSLLAIDPQGVKQLPQPQQTIKYPDGETAFNIYDLDQGKLDLERVNK